MATAIAPTAPATVKVEDIYNPQNPSGLIATAVPAAMGTTANATAASYDPTKWNVNNDQTVQGQVKNIIDANSPLMQQADTRSKQQMNSRGLMNSSMAIGAGQAALYDAALPIAQADAQTNVQSANFNANAANRSSEFNSGNVQQTNLANTAATNRASEFNAGNIQQTNVSNANAANTAISDSNKIRAQAATLDADASNKMLLVDLDNKFKTAITNADAANKFELQTMADNTKKDLAAVEATFKQMISTNEQGGALYSKAMQNITDIVNNPDMVAADKTVAIENQKTMLKSGLTVLSEIAGIDLGALLVFEP